VNIKKPHIQATKRGYQTINHRRLHDFLSLSLSSLWCLEECLVLTYDFGIEREDEGKDGRMGRKDGRMEDGKERNTGNGEGEGTLSSDVRARSGRDLILLDTLLCSARALLHSTVDRFSMLICLVLVLGSWFLVLSINLSFVVVVHDDDDGALFTARTH